MSQKTFPGSKQTTKQGSFALIELLVVLAIFILTAAGGVVVWERKVTPAPSPTPSATLTPRPTLIPSVSPKVPLPVDQTFKFCEKDKDCKIIFSGCTCDATNINDPRKHLIIPGEPDCLVNSCKLPYRIEAVAVCLNNQCQVKLKVISNVSPIPTKIPQPTSITWEEAKRLILTGLVKEVYQSHSLSVTLRLKDGNTKIAREPKIDDVFDIIDECGGLCSDSMKMFLTLTLS